MVDGSQWLRNRAIRDKDEGKGKLAIRRGSEREGQLPNATQQQGNRKGEEGGREGKKKEVADKRKETREEINLQFLCNGRLMFTGGGTNLCNIDSLPRLDKLSGQFACSDHTLGEWEASV